MAIEEIALQKGHEIVLRIGLENLEEFTKENLQQADVAIEFTGPHSAVQNITTCMDAGLPVICGSTGWLNQYEEIIQYCKQKNGAFLYASNFSIGVNLFFELNSYLARLMSRHTNYNISIEEIHHTEKKDAPSGTAISLAEQIMQNNPAKKQWINHENGEADDLPVISRRIDLVPGTHTINYSSDIDDITITHTAHNRKGFAAGAVLAAEFIQNKKGIFSMKDVLDL